MMHVLYRLYSATGDQQVYGLYVGTLLTASMITENAGRWPFQSIRFLSFHRLLKLIIFE